MFVTTAVAQNVIFVMGMVGRDAEGSGVEGIEAQTLRSLERAEAALAEHGVDRGSICRLRVFLTNVENWSIARRVVDEWFHERVPPATAVGVTGLVEPWMEIEIEVEAALDVS